MNDTRFPAPPPAARDVSVAANLRRPVTRAEVLHGLVGVPIGLAIVLAALSLAPPDAVALPDVTPWHLLALPLVIYGVVVVHEFGHLAAGLAVGMRPFALYAGPLHLDFSAGGVRLRRNRTAARVGGLAICVPKGRSSRAAYCALIAGGPLANVLLALVAVALATTLGAGTAAALALLVGVVSALLAFVNLLPMRVAGGYTTDGGQLVQLVRGDPSVRAGLAVAALVAQSFAGTRPRDLDLAPLDALRDACAPHQAAAALLFHAAAALDRGDRAAARERHLALAQLLEAADDAALPVATRRGLAIGVATWLGQYEDDAPGARAWLEYTRGGLLDATAIERAEAAVALAERRVADALAHVARVREALPRYVDRGGALAMAEQLDALERRLAETRA